MGERFLASITQVTSNEAEKTFSNLFLAANKGLPAPVYGALARPVCRLSPGVPASPSRSWPKWASPALGLATTDSAPEQSRLGDFGSGRHRRHRQHSERSPKGLAGRRGRRRHAGLHNPDPALAAGWKRGGRRHHLADRRQTGRSGRQGHDADDFRQRS